MSNQAVTSIGKPVCWPAILVIFDLGRSINIFDNTDQEIPMDQIDMKPPTRFNQGFTLIEIMVVIVILGVLAALIVPKVMSRPDEARIMATKQDIGAISQALKLYKLDNLRYPTTEQGLRALISKPTLAPIPQNWHGNGYIEKLPKDPWGAPYQYLQPGMHGEVDILSYGADSEPGGEGNNADIGSWDL